MESLQFLIDELTQGRNFHISILDLSGILHTPSTKIKFKNVVHIKNFCNMAKSTPMGYRVCMHCKMLANSKAIQDKESFCGHCLYGLYEIAKPVVIGDSVAAVVYVGNAMIDEQKSKELIYKVCERTGVNPSAMVNELKRCERIESPNELFRIANLVADYMVWLHHSTPKQKEKEKTSWLVSVMKDHADRMYKSEVSLTELADTYQKNEKYMGRLFKQEIGVSFSEYKRARRLELAESMILQSDEKIIDIALECGFNNISYFNRAFKEKYGASPNEYRAKSRSTRKP